jgi:hypothetical protein
MQLGNAKESHMPKEEFLQFESLVVETPPDTRYRVKLDNGHALVTALHYIRSIGDDRRRA